MKWTVDVLELCVAVGALHHSVLELEETDGLDPYRCTFQGQEGKKAAEAIGLPEPNAILVTEPTNGCFPVHEDDIVSYWEKPWPA